MRTTRTNLIAEVGLAIALFVTFQLMFRWVLPINIAGGSVSLAMLPILILALRRGLKVGILTGVLCGVADMALPQEFYAVHPIQVLLDYPLAFGACGLAGLGAAMTTRLHDAGRTLALSASTVAWCTVGVLGRFAFATISGLVFFSANAPAGQPVLLYSMVYNASYLAPSLVATAAAAAVLVPALWSRVPAPVVPTHS